MEMNCDITDRLTDSDKTGKVVYGKKMLTSHRPYDLWNEENNTFNLENIEKLYDMFIENMIIATGIFETRWVKPEELVTTSKSLIWDWTDNEEKMRTAKDILENGMYFPIFTLDRGKLHNQILSPDEMKELASKNLYNSYNGNHRIDVIHYWRDQGLWDKNVLIYIIPEFCQKSCTGFKYTLIDDHDDNNPLTREKLASSVKMFHLDWVEHEMKVTNWRERKEISPGVSIVTVDNYNVAFRLMTEFQNVLEQPLTHYYKTYGKLPRSIVDKSQFFNGEDLFNKILKEAHHGSDISHSGKDSE